MRSTAVAALESWVIRSRLLAVVMDSPTWAGMEVVFCGMKGVAVVEGVEEEDTGMAKAESSMNGIMM